MKTFHLAVLSALLATSSSLFAQVKVTDQEYKAAAPVRAVLAETHFASPADGATGVLLIIKVRAFEAIIF